MNAPARQLGAESAPLARQIFDRFEELKSDRNQRAGELDAVARIYRPQRAGFHGSTGDRNQWNLHELFNSTTLVAAGNLTASLYSTLCNPANDWFQATTLDRDLAEWHTVKEWLDIVSRRMLASFSPGVSNFYSSAVTWLADVPVLGTGFMISDEGRGRTKLIDTCISPADAVFSVDADGMADELIVERWLSPMAAARFYGAENLPPRLRDKAAAGKTNERTRFIQAIQPNDDYTPGRLGTKGMPYVSTHVSEDGMALVKQGGMREQPFAVPRWDTDGANPWGRGLGYLTLASGRKLQAITRDNLSAGALAAKPPMGTVGTRAIKEGAKIAPGAFLHGAISHSGQQLVRPITTFNGLPITAEQERQSKEEVENAWHAQLLSLVGRTGLGPLEVIERMEERLRLQAPFLGRTQTEGLAFVLERRFGLLFRAGQFPPPPPEMANQPLEIRFTSVAALAQRAQEGVAAARLLEDTYKLAGAQPDPAAAADVWDNVDTDRALGVLAEARGAPASMLRSPEQREARRQQRAQAAQAQQMMAMAQQGAAAAKDLSAAMGPEGAM